MNLVGQSSSDSGGVSSWRAYMAMALASCAILLYEVAITRILSVLLWYHFAFLAISLAMLGLGLPGVWFTLRRPGPSSLRTALLASGVAVPGSVVLLLKGSEVLGPTASVVPGLGVFLDARLLLVLAALLGTFVCLGSAVCLLLTRAGGRTVGRMYAADLLGATVGAAAIVPLMIAVPTPLLVAGAGLLPLAAAVLVGRGTAWTAPAIAVLLAGGMVWGEPFHLRVTKNYAEPDNVLFERWTPTARIAVFADIPFWSTDANIGFGWGMGDRYTPAPLEQLWIEQDGSAGTPITRLVGSPSALSHLFFDVTSVGYQLRPPARVCIIGAGGGRDILTALKAGATDVDAVELNRGIVAALSGRFRDYSGDVYHLPGVHAVVSEGRSFLTRSPREYDLIQISLIDSWAATAAGAFALSENYLYTVEALRLYLQRTSSAGLVSISRWMAGDRQLEGARLASLATKALELEGVSDPGAHIAVVQAGEVGTFLLSRTPFDAAEIARLASISAERGFRRPWPIAAGQSPDSLVALVLARGIGDAPAMGLDLTPSTDDRPFFFQTVSLLGSVDRSLLATLSPNEQSVTLLRMLLIVMAVLTLGLFFAPFLLGQRLASGPELWVGSAYFLCIGLGFMLVEMPWMQRFVLYLGHPSYATTVVLAALLLGAGVGSLTASRMSLSRALTWGPCLPAVLLGIDFLLAPVFRSTLGWSFAARVLASAMLLVPAGFLMGFAFPLGMIAFKNENRAWFWAMNGAASVLASVFSLALSMIAGFTATARLGIAFYLAAYLLFLTRKRWLQGQAFPAAAISASRDPLCEVEPSS